MKNRRNVCVAMAVMAMCLSACSDSIPNKEIPAAQAGQNILVVETKLANNEMTTETFMTTSSLTEATMDTATTNNEMISKTFTTTSSLTEATMDTTTAVKTSSNNSETGVATTMNSNNGNEIIATAPKATTTVPIVQGRRLYDKEHNEIPLWDEKTFDEKYIEARFGTIYDHDESDEYVPQRKLISDDQIGDYIGKILIIGRDPYMHETHYDEADAFLIEGCEDMTKIAIKSAEDESFHLFEIAIPVPHYNLNG